MIIKNTTKLGSLFKEYPQLKMSIAAILPDLGSLEQPHLREKVLSITTIEHLARKTDRDVSDIIEDLNKIIGIELQPDDVKQNWEYLPEDPDWIKDPPLHQVDGVEILTKGEHPLSVIQGQLIEMSPGEMIQLSTNFHPQPLLEALDSSGVTTYSRKDIRNENLFITFIRK